MLKVNKKLIGIIMLVAVSSTGLMACKPYNTPEFKDISPSQTAFAIPLQGDASNQVKMNSEEEAAKNLVNSKRVQIQKEWVQTGKSPDTGVYMPTETIIIVERKPETREWTEAEGTGTSSTNQGIKAESKESIGFMARMNCTASIQENDAAKFLFYYNDKALKDIMDTEIRANIESEFVKQCASRSMDDILSQKADIMDAVVKEVTTTFSAKGITISQLGLKGDLTYDNPDTQKAIDANFQAEKNQEAQAINNKTNEDKAIADAQVIQSQASTIKDTIALKQADAALTEAQAKVEMAKSLANMKDIHVLGNNPIMDAINGTASK